MEIEGEQAYPIYCFRAKWSEDGEHREHSRFEGLAAGRIWNSMSPYDMFRESLNTQAVAVKAREWWSVVQKKRSDKHPADVVIVATFERHETWCGTWFNHWTFDNGQTDEQVLVSFARFVDRMLPLCAPPLSIEAGEYCLMGAEDRSRWCGTKDGHTDNQTPPPCRCEYCKAQGVVRIGH